MPPTSVFIGFAVIFLSGCGSDPVQIDLIEYINKELPKAEPLEAEMVDAYKSVSGDNFTDDATMHETLKEVVQPKCRDIIAIVEYEISPETSEVRQLHEIYIDSFNKQYEAYLLLQDALEKQDLETMSRANEKLTDAAKLQRQWLNQLEELKKQHDVLTE